MPLRGTAYANSTQGWVLYRSKSCSTATRTRARQSGTPIISSGYAKRRVTSAVISTRSASLSATCRYSDMAPTPSASAILRMDTPDRPSESAISMALPTIDSKVRRGSVTALPPYSIDQLGQFAYSVPSLLRTPYAPKYTAGAMPHDQL
ncbi:Uncharacterised protein [Mycobacteroides abscessus subsp. abscessus]|nr:Uncharacterised protein [Mycobacteroides abscessus subsp. abscessus]